MRADEGELLLGGRLGDRLQHGLMQGFDGRVGAAGGRGFRDPGRMLEHISESGDKLRRRHGIELFQREFYASWRIRAGEAEFNILIIITNFHDFGAAGSLR